MIACNAALCDLALAVYYSGFRHDEITGVPSKRDRLIFLDKYLVARLSNDGMKGSPNTARKMLDEAAKGVAYEEPSFDQAVACIEMTHSVISIVGQLLDIQAVNQDDE
jgi:hypothetical protein